MDQPQSSIAAAPGGALPRLLEKALPLAVFSYVAIYFAPVCLFATGLGDREGYYHSRVAQMLPGFGLSRDFVWTQASVWNGRYCDKEFLYHVLLIPFTRDPIDPVNGARLFFLLSAVAFFVTLYWVLRKNAVPAAALFTLLPLCMGGHFLARLDAIRAHVVSISLTLIGMHLLLQARWKALLVLGFIYSWTYSVPYVLVVHATLFSAGVWLGGGGLNWRLPLAATLGVAAGLLIHPYSPHTLEMLLTCLSVIRGACTADTRVVLGEEMYPYGGMDFIRCFPLTHLLMAGLLIGGWRFGRRISPQAVGALCAALAWYCATLAIQRSSEYAIPLVALALGLVVRDLTAGIDFKRLWAEYRVSAMGILLGLAVGLLYFHLDATRSAGSRDAYDKPPLFRGALTWLAEKTQPGETVVNLFWHNFPELFYDGSRQRFLWGMDPTFTLRWDSELGGKLHRMGRGEEALDRAWLADTFKARYMIFPNYEGSYEKNTYPEIKSGQLKPVYADAYAIVFPLIDPPTAEEKQ